MKIGGSMLIVIGVIVVIAAVAVGAYLLTSKSGSSGPTTSSTTSAQSSTVFSTTSTTSAPTTTVNSSLASCGNYQINVSTASGTGTGNCAWGGGQMTVEYQSGEFSDVALSVVGANGQTYATGSSLASANGCLSKYVSSYLPAQTYHLVLTTSASKGIASNCNGAILLLSTTPVTTTSSTTTTIYYANVIYGGYFSDCAALTINTSKLLAQVTATCAWQGGPLTGALQSGNAGTSSFTFTNATYSFNFSTNAKCSKVGPVFRAKPGNYTVTLMTGNGSYGTGPCTGPAVLNIT